MEQIFHRRSLHRTQLDRLLHVAEGRIAQPQIGANAFPKPYGTDWSWRPELWLGPLPITGLSSVETKSMLGTEVTLFHDCPLSELTLRQCRNTHKDDLAPYGFPMDVFKFGGSFLSLVVDLPTAAVDGLTRNHLIRVTAVI